jgi:lipoate-protein ligase A
MSDYPSTTWRLLRSAPADGAANMAIDEAILHTIAAGHAPPTLRFYAWEPPCLSLGRAQEAADVDMNALKVAGFDLVRRPTGGKAILHADELTYSVIAPETEPRVAGGVVEGYRCLSAGLVRGLAKLGVTGIVADQRVPPPSPPHRGGSQVLGPVCFEAPSDYEITVGGRKLVGSAQMRAHRAVLQHGALPLHGDIARICPLLAAHPDPARVRARATTIEEALGKRASWDEVAEALAEGFAEALNLRLEPGALTKEERAQAKLLRAEKYATEAWTRRV